MKRMVDNEKVESIGLNEFIVNSNNAKRYYSRLAVSFDGNDISGFQMLSTDYLLNKHITKTISVESIEEFLNLVTEYCNDISINDYIVYDNINGKFKIYSIQFTGPIGRIENIYFRQYIQGETQQLVETVNKNSEPNLLNGSITDLTTGKYIVIDI